MTQDIVSTSVLNSQESPIEVHPDVIGLKGGEKQQWLRLHRGEVKSFYFRNGPDATMERFNLKQATLERFLSPGRESHEHRINKWSQSDKEVYMVAMEGVREVRGRVLKLEEWRDGVQPVIDAGRALLTLNNIQLQSQNLPAGKETLRLADLGVKSEK